MRVRRLQPLEHINQVACIQMRSLIAQRPPGNALPIFAFDVGYEPNQLVQGLEDWALGIVVRLRAGRCFYADPVPLPAGAPGRPRRHGAKFACGDPASWWEPTDEYQQQDPAYGDVRVRSWAGVHAIPQHHERCGTRGPRPLVRGTLILVEVERLPKQTRPPEPMGLWWWGPTPPDLSLIWLISIARFTLEHTFRFFKQVLGWTTPRVRQPDQADRWTWLLLLAWTHLRLARTVVTDGRLPWEKPCAPAALTPGRVRRAFSHLLPALGSPVNVPKPCGRSPGRPKGRRSIPAPRFPAVKKAG